MSTITRRQKETYDYIVSYLNKNGYSPSYSEIAYHFHLSSVATVYDSVVQLVKKGFLKKIKGVPNGLEPIKKTLREMLEVPLVGAIACGRPIEAIEVPDTVIEIAKDRRFQEGELYALKAKGNSMIGDGIFDGDFLIVKKQEWADDGDTAVAIIDDNEATLKKYYKEKGQIRLQPANPAFSPIYRKQVEIRGIVIKVIRDLKQ